ncbi:hypothetical protein BXZ70DRAFT_1009045 [Cristinia sonorae]|uniref:Uncharacterized protein n=1 Tax=Cristinia sonorae TaxID=1940300 RepID=A0A8K0ULP5_9AGAR|nr:hypothetical protein BXZ70DRAFT_1009045 [Cristinia sonorae]
MSPTMRSRAHSFSTTFNQLTKRRTPSAPPPTPTNTIIHTTSPTNVHSSRKLHIHLPQLFKMHPWQKSAYAGSHPTLVDSQPFGDEPSPDLESFAWSEVEKTPVVDVRGSHVVSLSNHNIGHKILEDFDFDSSSSSSSSSGSDHEDLESESSEITITHSASPSATSASSPSSTTAPSAHTSIATALVSPSGPLPAEGQTVALTPPWWHYSLRRKMYRDDEARPWVRTENDDVETRVLADDVGRWPDQEHDSGRFVF